MQIFKNAEQKAAKYEQSQVNLTAKGILNGTIDAGSVPVFTQVQKRVLDEAVSLAVLKVFKSCYGHGEEGYALYLHALTLERFVNDHLSTYKGEAIENALVQIAGQAIKNHINSNDWVSSPKEFSQALSFLVDTNNFKRKLGLELLKIIEEKLENRDIIAVMRICKNFEVPKNELGDIILNNVDSLLLSYDLGEIAQGLGLSEESLHRINMTCYSKLSAEGKNPADIIKYAQRAKVPKSNYAFDALDAFRDAIHLGSVSEAVEIAEGMKWPELVQLANELKRSD